jgi:hypothetical protein
MLDGADTVNTVVDRVTAEVLMRPLSSRDRRTIVDWLVAEAGVDADETLAPPVPEQVAALTAAVLVSSAYFHLR